MADLRRFLVNRGERREGVPTPYTSYELTLCPLGRNSDVFKF